MSNDETRMTLPDPPPQVDADGTVWGSKPITPDAVGFVPVNEHKRSKPRKPRQPKPGPRSHERIAADLVKQAQRVKDAETRLADARKAWDALLREAAEVGK